jgi:hypothetical protein
MNAHYNPQSRFSATGLTTAAVLIVVLAMAASTLFPDAPTPGAGAAAAHPQVARSHDARQVKKS